MESDLHFKIILKSLILLLKKKSLILHRRLIHEIILYFCCESYMEKHNVSSHQEQNKFL